MSKPKQQRGGTINESFSHEKMVLHILQCFCHMCASNGPIFNVLIFRILVLRKSNLLPQFWHDSIIGTKSIVGDFLNNLSGSTAVVSWSICWFNAKSVQ